MPLRYLWGGSPCRRPARKPLRHAEMALEYLWAGFPCRRPARASVRNRFDTGSRQSCHVGMPLRHLWAGSPCRRAVRRTLRHDWMPLEHLCAYSPCRRPVISPLCHARVLLRYLWARSPCQREDLELNQNLNVHEKGSNHGQTRFESPNPSLNSTIFIILAKSGVSTRAPYPMYGVFSQKAYLRRLLQDASDFRSRR